MELRPDRIKFKVTFDNRDLGVEIVDLAPPLPSGVEARIWEAVKPFKWTRYTNRTSYEAWAALEALSYTLMYEGLYAVPCIVNGVRRYQWEWKTV